MAHTADEHSEKVNPVFPELTGDIDDSGVSEIESLCFSCYKQVCPLCCDVCFTVMWSDTQVHKLI